MRRGTQSVLASATFGLSQLVCKRSCFQLLSVGGTENSSEHMLFVPSAQRCGAGGCYRNPVTFVDSRSRRFSVFGMFPTEACAVPAVRNQAKPQPGNLRELAPWCFAAATTTSCIRFVPRRKVMVLRAVLPELRMTGPGGYQYGFHVQAVSARKSPGTWILSLQDSGTPSFKHGSHGKISCQ